MSEDPEVFRVRWEGTVMVVRAVNVTIASQGGHPYSARDHYPLKVTVTGTLEGFEEVPDEEDQPSL